VVDGVAVDPPVTVAQAERLAAAGLLADRPETLVAAWDRLGGIWDETVGQARGLSDDQAAQRVAGEWSFVETQRHLVFTTDAWIGRIVLGRDGAFHPVGLPPDFMDARMFGIDVDAHPTLDEMLAVRDECRATVRELLAGATPEDLAREGQNGFTVLGAVQVVMFEEWAHHEYATRDLAKLGDADAGAP
jgi:DinB superfamily